jgi:hypothetical protein
MPLRKRWMVAAAVCCMVAACAHAPPEAKVDDGEAQRAAAELAARNAALAAHDNDVATIGADAVIYGLPLVIMDMTKRLATNVPRSQSYGHAPVNQFAHQTALPTSANRSAANLNVDTLYSWGWIDVAKEPIVLSMPNTGGRYYLISMVDAWTNVSASLGKRTTGTKARRFVITGPGWTGKLPAGLTEVKSPTTSACLVVRMETNGPGDNELVRAMQKGYRLTPLSMYGKPFTPPPGVVDANLNMQMSPVDQVTRMSSATFLKTLATLMRSNPPPPGDAAALARFATIGLVPGQDFDIKKLDHATARALAKSMPAALEQLKNAPKDTDVIDNGWILSSPVIGDYGTHYRTRAINATRGLGSNLPADVVFATSAVDGEGDKLEGSRRYVLHFVKGQTPPTNAFWSLTMYNAQGAFVDNALSRYSIAGWMPLKYNKDGSLDLYIQNAAPGKDKDANWLPAPAAAFNLTLRIYSPKPPALDGTWHPPAVATVK